MSYPRSRPEMRRPVWDGRRSVDVMATPGVHHRMQQDLRTARIHREHAAAGPQADLEARIAILTAYLDRPGPTRRAVTAP